MFFLMACGGGSCSSCAGCGIDPVPGGFPLDQRIDNAVQVRLTDQGITNVEQNIDPLVNTILPTGLNFPISRMQTSTDIPIDLGFLGTIHVSADIDICPSNDCGASASIKDLQLTLTPPSTITARIQLILYLTDAAGNPRDMPVDLTAAGFINTSCDIGLDTRNMGSRDYVEATADVTLTGDMHDEWKGFTKATVGNIQLTQSIEDADVSIGGCSGLAGAIINILSGTVVSFLVPELENQIGGLVNGLVNDQLCMQADPTVGCPSNTTDMGGVCYYDSDPGTCVPMLLGLAGQGDIGASILSGFSPGAHGRLRFLAALGGDARMVNNGISLQMYGGAQSLAPDMTTSPAHNPCVPVTDPPPLPDVPLASQLEGNTIPGTGGSSDVGIGVSQSFMNYAGWQAFDSGMLCLGAGTNLSQQLSTGLVSILVKSLNNLTFPDAAAPLAIMIRPQQAPDIQVGDTASGESLLNVSLPQASIDFYVWSQERFVRFMTFTSDLSIGIDLQVDSATGMITPAIGDVVAENASVTNSDLITEDPDTLATMLSSLLGGFAGALTGSIPPIALPDLMGLQLMIPDGGVQGFSDQGENFLGIFANIGVAGAGMALAPPTDTQVDVTDVTMDPHAMQLETWGQGDLPTIHAYAKAFGTGIDYEYSYRLDGMEWSAWTTDPDLVIQDDVLLFQAHHTLEVRSRVAGDPGSVDPTPASADVLVDLLPPEVREDATDDGQTRVTASDVVSPKGTLEYRARAAGDDWSAWAKLGDGATVADGTEVEVRDEAHNVGRAQEALIRGVPDPNASGACDCAVPGSPGSSAPLAGLGILFVLGLAVRGRRRWQKRPSAAGAKLSTRARRIARHLLPFLVIALAFYAIGCGAKGGGGGGGDAGSNCMAPATLDMPKGEIECNDMCVAYDIGMLGCGANQVCQPDTVTVDGDCKVTCGECILPPVSPGQLATYLDMTALSDGTLVLSGYSPGNPNLPRLLGDLVVGTYDGSEISWELLDGVPDETPTLDPDGWRGGVTQAGPDVGKWTSIAAAGDDTMYVSYYDVDNSALKVAIGTSGSWALQTVDDEGDAGKYTSIALEGGAPRVAYLQVVPPDGDGRPMARARVAIANGPSPAAPGDWTLTTAHEVSIDCRKPWCPSGTQCYDDGQCHAAAPMGATVVGDDYLDQGEPIVTGLYNNLFVDSTGLALVFYDRTSGNLYGTRYDGMAWSAPFLIDGYARGLADVGDSGISASVFVDGDTWHVSYVDGAQETLRYATVMGDAASNWQVVDDGSAMGSVHVVGSDSSIAKVGDELRIVYQDSTDATALIATGMGDGTWDVSVLDDMDNTGFWLEQVVTGSTSNVCTFWETAAAATSGTRILTYP